MLLNLRQTKIGMSLKLSMSIFFILIFREGKIEAREFPNQFGGKPEQKQESWLVEPPKIEYGSQEDEPQTHPEYTIPLYPQVRKPEPAFQPLYIESRPPGMVRPENKYTYQPPRADLAQNYYPPATNPMYEQPKYGEWQAPQSDYPQYMPQNQMYQYPQKYQFSQPNSQYPVEPQIYYEEPRPRYSTGRYMPRTQNESAWPQNEPQYDPYYRTPPPGFARPVPQSNYYMGGPRAAMHPGMGLYSGAPDFIPRGNLSTVPIQRNEFIEDFKQKLIYNKKIELKDLKGHIIELAKDQFGSRYLQQQVQKGIPEEKQLIFEEIKSQAYELMSDVFGNYVIQVLMQEGSEANRTSLIDLIKGRVKLLSLDIYGCRCVQKAIEIGKIEQKIVLLTEISSSVPEFVESQNANHVLQKCIETTPVQNIGFLLDYFKTNSIAMCRHSFGCRVLQRIIEKCKIINVL